MLLAIYAHDKYLNVRVPINGTKHTLKEVKFMKLSSTPPHAYEDFAQSVDTAECQLSTLNAFFV